MERQLIAFDLDDTVTVSKSRVSDRMADCLARLTNLCEVAIISGGRFEQFEEQLLRHLDLEVEGLERIHALPTSGTRYYTFDRRTNAWVTQYVEDLDDGEKSIIEKVLLEGAAQLGLVEAETFGPVLEDRGSQITFSALGQNAPADLKYAWDPDKTKKMALRSYAAERLPGHSVKSGGSTSVDVTREGIDKAYGMRRLLDARSMEERDVLFFGDQLELGGNDYPVKAMGIDCIQVRDWQETAVALDAILATH